MQVSAIPSGPTYYQPIQAAPPVAPVKPQDADADGNTPKVRPTPPPGVGSLLDIQA
ncbi:hypothetical protein [Phenylobacterium sp.]|jgi:hypothetical protein|uniref:hypothetical protein n=1 Tax=Phenylobacterium sp. TaxID=1871053 RepID=UPI002F41DA3E